MSRTHRREMTVALALALASVANLQAQGSPAPSGQLVRITARSAGIRGEIATLVAVTPDSFVLLRTLYVARSPVAQPDTVRSSVARGSVERLEVRSRIGALTMPAALVGGVLGAVAGANAGRHSGYSRCGFWFVFCFELSPGDKATIYGIVGGGIGMGVGAVLGSLVGREHWRTIAPDELPLTVAPDSAVRTVVRIPGASRPLPWLEPGQRVRVTAPAAGLTRAVASLAALSAESLVVVRTGPVSGMPDSASIPRRLVTAFDASAGRRGHTVLGIVIGLVNPGRQPAAV